MRLTFGTALMAAVVAAGCSDARISQPVSAAGGSQPAVARGEYLVKTIGCGDCHTPMKMGPSGPEPDLSRLLSGHPEQLGPLTAPQLPEKGPWMWAGAATMTAFAGPWGVSYAANLTPDRNTGLGIWTEDMFVTALRTGKHMGTSRPIMPPMPWTAFRNATDDDLKAMYAYLRTIKPIANHVPDYAPPVATH
jgi:mono/diheme cytochrome c family protein